MSIAYFHIVRTLWKRNNMPGTAQVQIKVLQLYAYLHSYCSKGVEKVWMCSSLAGIECRPIANCCLKVKIRRVRGAPIKKFSLMAVLTSFSQVLTRRNKKSFSKVLPSIAQSNTRQKFSQPGKSLLARPCRKRAPRFWHLGESFRSSNRPPAPHHYDERE